MPAARVRADAGRAQAGQCERGALDDVRAGGVHGGEGHRLPEDGLGLRAGALPPGGPEQGHQHRAGHGLRAVQACRAAGQVRAAGHGRRAGCCGVGQLRAGQRHRAAQPLPRRPRRQELQVRQGHRGRQARCLRAARPELRTAVGAAHARRWQDGAPRPGRGGREEQRRTRRP